MAFQSRDQVDPLEKEAIAIQKRRARDAERVKVLLNAKQRKYGVDYKALDKQIQEKKEREQAQKDYDRHWENITQDYAAQISELDVIRAAEARKEKAELLNYLSAQMREKKKRELIEAEYARNQRTGEETPFLNFEGEDPHKDEREQAQKAQMQEWLAQHIDHAEAVKANEAEQERRYNEYQSELDEMKLQLEKEAAYNKAVEKSELRQTNLMLAQAKKEREHRDAMLDKLAGERELEYHSNSDFMMEVTHERNNCGHRKGGAVNVVPYNFKGFTVEQKQKIQQEQLRQIEYHRQQKEQEINEQRAYEEEQEVIRRQVLGMEIERQAARQQEILDLARDRQEQAREHKNTQRLLHDKVYQNPIDDSFYEQFGKSAR